LALIDREGS